LWEQFFWKKIFFESWLGDSLLHFKHELFESDSNANGHAKGWDVIQNLYTDTDAVSAAPFAQEKVPEPAAVVVAPAPVNPIDTSDGLFTPQALEEENEQGVE